MKRVMIGVVFILSTLISVLVFLPYSKIYTAAITKLAKENGINLQYTITRATPIHLYLKDITVTIGSKSIRMDEFKLRFSPIKFVADGLIARIIAKVSGKEGDFQLSKHGSTYRITGIFATGLLQPFIEQQYATLLAGMHGTDTLTVVLKPEKNLLRINELKIVGDFELVAHGYIKNGRIRLMGLIKIGNLRENFVL